AYVALVAEKVAEVHKISLKEVAEKTSENVKELFGI
ncbi:MAG: hydrolase TatD, partial [Melioribacteraceae bacterium]